MKEVSDAIRKYRFESGLTLKDLSGKTGLSASFLSQVERGSSSLAITSLKKIAVAMDLHITDFFKSYANENYIVKTEDQNSFRIEGSRAKYTRLGGNFSGKVMEPLLVVLSPGCNWERESSHPGEEFYYVLNGVVIFTINDKKFLVKEGESIHFPSNIPHYWENPLGVDSKILCILTPVIF